MVKKLSSSLDLDFSEEVQTSLFSQYEYILGYIYSTLVVAVVSVINNPLN